MVAAANRLISATLLLLVVAASAQAAVVARVDRDRIEQNETFSLEITVDSTADLQPDLSVLDKDFIIGQSSRLSNTRIVNGQISRSMTWTVSLMPRRAGKLTIPPITVGSEQSNPVTITVTAPRAAPPGEADVFITADVDYAETFVQAQVLYTIRIYRAVATRQPALREPMFSGAEVLVELAGDEKSYEAVLNGRAYNVVERAFAVFPQASGTVEISPARFEARVLRDGRITGRKVFESEPLTITVNPIPAPPDEFPDAAWLPAKEVVLSDSWSRDVDELRVGEPISRNVTIEALGQLETQIPVVAPPTAAGANFYPDKPALSRRIEAGGIRGVRTDQYAMIGVADGPVTLPELELPWWDIDAGEWRVARVPERTITILPSPDVTPVEPTPPPEVVADAPATPDDGEPVPSKLWRRIAEGLAVLWLLTLGAWWWSSRPRREHRAPAEVPVHRRQARVLKDASKAAAAGDAAAVRRELLAWAQLEWPTRAPRSIGELAARVPAPLADELERLSAASYGPGDGDFDRAALAKAIRGLPLSGGDAHGASRDPLPPLMPDTG